MANLVGMEFPFRINSKGGINLKRQTAKDTSIFDGKLTQLLNTSKGERTMECHVFANLDVYLFNPTDPSTRSFIEYQIREAVAKHIPEIDLTECTVYAQNNRVYALVGYKVRNYDTQSTAIIGLNGGAKNAEW